MKNYSYSGPPELEIASGASAPDPGLVGATLWSTLEQRMLVWDGGAWAVSRAMPQAQFEEVVRKDGRIVAIVNWADSTRTRKLSEVAITRTNGWTTSTVERQYNQLQAVVQTLTTTVTHDANGRATSVNAVST